MRKGPRKALNAAPGTQEGHDKWLCHRHNDYDYHHDDSYNYSTVKVTPGQTNELEVL